MIVIPGQTVSKKNSKRVFCRGNRPTVLPSQAHETWHREALSAFHGHISHEGEIAEVTITFYPKTARTFDLSNHAESVMDLLVDAGVIPDDSWKVVPELKLRYGDIDRDNPRVEVEIL